MAPAFFAKPNMIEPITAKLAKSKAPEIWSIHLTRDATQIIETRPPWPSRIDENANSTRNRYFAAANSTRVGFVDSIASHTTRSLPSRWGTKP